MREPGPGQKQFNFRKGVEQFPRLRGINRATDAGSIPPNQHYNLENVNLFRDQIESRVGQSASVMQTMSGCVLGIIDVADSVKSIVIRTGVGSPALFYYDQDATPNAIKLNTDINCQTISVTPSTLARTALISFQDKLLLSGTTDLQELNIPTGTTLQAGDATAIIKAVSYQKGVNGISNAVVNLEADVNQNSAGVMYMGATTGGVVRRFDGVSLTNDSGNLGAGRQIVGLFNGDIVVCGTQYLKQRLGGSWTNFAIPTLTGFIPTCAAQYGNKIYFGGYDPNIALVQSVSGPAKIISFDGTTVLVARDPVDGTGWHGDWIDDLAIFDLDGKLYYGWDASGDGVSYLGTYDGTTWTDVVATFTPLEGNPRIGRMQSVGQLLYITVTNSDMRLYQWDGSSATVLVDFVVNTGGVGTDMFIW
jgi:hypothetical protein